MLPVEIVPVQESVVLRARGSELLILPHHVRHLKSCEKPKDFSEYFRAEALVNRPARKLFEAWLRKDDSLWKRLYICIHKEMEIKAEEASEEAPVKTKAKDEPKAKAKAEEKPAKEAKKDEPKAKAKAEEKPAKEAKKEVKAAKEEPKAKAKAKAEDEKPAKKVKADDKAEKKTTKKVAKADDDKPAAKKKTKTASAGAAKKKKG